MGPQSPGGAEPNLGTVWSQEDTNSLAKCKTISLVTREGCEIITPMVEIHAYIDESGDDGIKAGSSDWFALTALMIPAQAAPDLGRGADRIKDRVGRRGKVLHWRDLSHNRKKAVIEELKAEDFTFASVLINKRHPEVAGRNLKGKRLYFYSFRLLAERISWFAAEYAPGQANTARLFPETRSSLSYADLRTYLAYIQTDSTCQIRRNVIASVSPIGKGASSLVQLCDSVSGAVYDAIQFKWGTIEDSYLLEIKDKLYRRGKLWGYGMKVMPYKPGEVPSSLLNVYPWMGRV